MCLILFAYRMHPTYKLIVASNRDEFYQRPTAPVHFWEDHPHILAGRDLEKMGTWMGITNTGRFAAITNYRDPKEKTDGKRSRGELVADFLKGTDNPAEYMKRIAAKRTSYPGYNLLVADKENLYYYSNIEGEIKKLPPGIYGVSNHLLNTDWPKVKRGKEGLATLAEENPSNLSDHLLTLLQNADPASDKELPKTGVSLEWERILSPMFIKTKGYGTRSSTIVLYSEDQVLYKERTINEGEMEEQEYKITL
ncbi:NRDE family protein [Bacillus carboniphilus]|uniref:NRDE family protein n=1 Tax=Bacillus carboniphilus TaxID=86663 RepID=A0ABN0W705_9BACI